MSLLDIECGDGSILFTVLFKGVDAWGVLRPGFSSAFTKTDELLLNGGWREFINGTLLVSCQNYLQNETERC